MTETSSDITSTLSTINDYIRWAASRFSAAGLCYGHGTASALDDAAALILHSIHQPYDLARHLFAAVLTHEERILIVTRVERRVRERIPSAYITHEAVFANLTFYVDERVLVPRSPIAELIEQQFTPWVDSEQVIRILDLCTGSGCIAIACAEAFPDAVVDAVDFSADALQVAKINVAKYQLGERLQLLESDLFAQLGNRKYDVIVSNPPYVRQAEWEQLPAEYHAEPKLGFDGGVSGLDIVLRILIDTPKFLTTHGILIVEVGSSAEILQQQLPNVLFYWLEFEFGGDGVFLLTAQQLAEYAQSFRSALL